MLKPQPGPTPAGDRKSTFSKIGFALSLAIFLIAVFLYHILHDIDTHELLSALKAADRRTLITAGCFVAAGLSDADILRSFALHTIAAPLPYRIAALAGFTSYAIVTMSAQRVLGGAVRYRVYSPGTERHRGNQICFVAGLTSGSAITVLGPWHSLCAGGRAAIDHLPPWSIVPWLQFCSRCWPPMSPGSGSSRA